MGGLFNVMPVTAISFLFCAFSVMGIPPFGGFFSKYMIISGTFQQGYLIIAATFLFGAFMTILYLFRAFNLVFLGERKNPSLPIREGSLVMLICVAIFALLSLLGGIFISFPNAVAQVTAQQIMSVK